MEKEQESLSNVKLAEIERLLDAFREEFKSKTSDANNFITIHEIERMWGDLQQNTLNIYSDIVRELINDIDESDLIRKKKESILKKE
jgi:hypothetical protein